MSDTPLSGASLGLDRSTDGQTAVGVFETPDGARYEDGGLLGKGGMGEVRAAHDRRLARTVALKTSAAGGRGADSLVLEAQLTARLEHPGIVPIYGAGEGADGNPYYTMPVVRGRSLSEAIRDAPGLAARLRLVRHFVDACQAVAYAHSQEVIHRDLKPPNVMVGGFGETLVVDWGLALPFAAAARGVSPAGTPEYSAPEQRAGGSLDVRADVYALGATLHELLTGARPAVDQRPPLEPRTPGVPPELAAVVTKATAYAREHRYPDVPSLIADVEAWFEGRRVGAYDYSAFELLRRFVTAWRTPLLLVLLGFTATALAIVNGFRNTASERDRAQAAEVDAVRERERAETHLARALVAQAVEAATDGRRAEAELLAVRALALEESPEARGVIARSWGQERPKLLARTTQPPCAKVLDISQERWLCREQPGLSRRTLGPGGEVEVEVIIDDEVTVAAIVRDAVFYGGSDLGVGRWQDGTLERTELGAKPFFIEADQEAGPIAMHGNGNLFGFERGSLRFTEALGCVPRSGFVDLASLGEDSVYLCRNGDLLLGPLHGEKRSPIGSMPLRGGVPIRVNAAEDGSRRAVATGTTGMVYIADADAPEDSFGFHSGLDVLAGRALLFGNQLALMSPEDGVRLYDVRSGSLLAVLPTRPRAARWVRDGVLRLVTHDAVEEWSIPGEVRPHLLPFDAGIAAVSVDRLGQLVASAHGMGQVRIVSLRSGALLREDVIHERVIKDVAFAPASDVLLATPALDRSVTIFRGPDWDPVRIPTPSNHRRVAWLSDTQALTAPYGKHPVLIDLSAAEPAVRELEISNRFVDLDRHEGRGGAVLRSEAGDFFTLEGLDTLARFGHDVSARGVAAGGGVLATLTTRMLTIWTGGTTREVTWTGPDNQDVAVSSDGAYVAVGRVDGTVMMYDPGGEELALMRGHKARVSALAFTADNLWLVSGSWDGDIRVWSIESLRQDAATLRADLEQSWGLDASEVLAL